MLTALGPTALTALLCWGVAAALRDDERREVLRVEVRRIGEIQRAVNDERQRARGLPG